MEIVKYEVERGILSVGFKEQGFVVYAAVPFSEGKSKEQLLQDAYKTVKQTIEYERTLEEHSFTTEEEGELFTPEAPLADRIDIKPLNSIVFEDGQQTVSVPLHATVYDQYGDKFDETIEWSASDGTIEEGVLILSQPETLELVLISAQAADIKASTELSVYPYVEPVDIKPIEQEVADVKQENEILQAKLNATSERADFIEDVIAEMAMTIYQ